MNEKLEALHQCSMIVYYSLDISVICPELYTTNLITQEEFERLQFPHMSQKENIIFLLDVLPRKEENWFDEFIKCLKETSDINYGHEKIMKELEHAKKNIENKGNLYKNDR